MVYNEAKKPFFKIFNRKGGDSMAKVKYGAMVADARGRMDGVVYSKNQYGAYVRQKVSPVNPLTARQTLIRARMSTLSKAWAGTLTQAQRDAWSGWAKLNPVVDVFNDKQQLSGIAMYNRLNGVILNAAAARIDDPPANLDILSLATITVTASSGPTAVSIAFTATPLGAGTLLYIYATPALSAGVTFFKPFLRFIGVSAAAQVSPFTATTVYTAKYGDTIAGTKIGFLVAVANTTTGAIAPGLAALVTVT